MERLLIALVLVTIIPQASTQSHEEYMAHRERCGTGEWKNYVPDREDEIARLRWECPSDGSFGCMPKRYIEENWTCRGKWAEDRKCVDTGIALCLEGEEYERAKADPCIAKNYPLQFRAAECKSMCMDLTLEELRRDVDQLKKEVMKKHTQ